MLIKQTFGELYNKILDEFDKSSLK